MILAYILGGVAIVVLMVVVLISLQAPEFRVARSITIPTPATAIFPFVNDFHLWEAWSPWEKLDPAMKRDYDGPPAGAGASYAWNGNNQVGEGRTTITESRPCDLIRIKLEFIRPFACTNDVEFTFKPEGEQTVVTWSMTGKKNFMAKAVHMLMNMDKMCGGQFEQGLANLRAAVTSTPASV